MRIHLNLTPTHIPGKKQVNRDGTLDLESVPPPLLALSPQGELVLIELQGSLEMDAPSDGVATPTVIGELHWGAGSEVKPTLMLSHHLLEGKLTSLSKPLAVLEKRQRAAAPPAAADDHQGSVSVPRGAIRDLSPNVPSSPHYALGATPGAAALLDASSSDEEEVEDVETWSKRQGRGGLPEAASPTANRKRGAGRAESPSSLSRPSKKLNVNRDRASRQTSSPSPPCCRPPQRLPSLSCSSSPPPPVLGSALDYSSPPRTSSAPSRQRNRAVTATTNDGETDDGRATAKEKLASNGGATVLPLDERTQVTSTYYDVVCIVRHRILFSKRPEPVVHVHAGAQQKPQH